MGLERQDHSVRNEGTWLVPLNVLLKTFSVLLGEEIVVGREGGGDGWLTNHDRTAAARRKLKRGRTLTPPAPVSLA